jgi:Bacterial Ig-like domain
MKNFLLLLLLLMVLIRFPLITGCANMIPPTGGPRDSLPPVLVTAVPAPRTLDFTAKRIVLTFDEYIDLKDARTELIVSPVPKIEPMVESKLRTLTIRMKDTLQPNTTYALNFGKSIRDINEGNILKNFTYVFTTGKYIDSLQYRGRVIMASTGKADSTLIVMLYDKLEDSAVVKVKPRYVTRVDTSGNFVFRYLHPGTYALYALKDESGTHMYNSVSQVFAFADTPVNIGSDPAPIQLYAYADTSGFKPVKKTAPVAVAPKKKDEKPRILLSVNIQNGILGLLDSFQLISQYPIRYFDSSKVRFTNDTFTNITGHYYYTEDSTHKKITLKYKWASGTKYHLILQKDFGEDTLGHHLLKIDTLTFTTKKESDYGNVKLRFRDIDLKKNPVLQFVQGDQVKYTHVFGNSHFFVSTLFEPGEYNLRILYDDNRNGKWDPGRFFDHPRVQPEKVVPITRKLNIRSNWDTEVDISL